MGLWSKLFGRPEFDTTVTDYQSTAHAGGPFRMVVADVFTITGRGTIVTGTVESGHVRVGDEVIVGTLPGVVRGVEMFQKRVDTATAGENVGLLIEGIAHDTVESGAVISGR